MTERQRRQSAWSVVPAPVLQLVNRSPFRVAMTVLPDVRGVETLFVLVRGAWRLSDGQLAPE